MASGCGTRRDRDTIRRYPCYEGYRESNAYIVRSHRVRNAGKGKGMKAMLERSTGKAILRYDHYRELMLDRPWRIPLLKGKMPPCPKHDSSAEDKGKYGLFLMFLFGHGSSQIMHCRRCSRGLGICARRRCLTSRSSCGSLCTRSISDGTERRL